MRFLQSLFVTTALVFGAHTSAQADVDPAEIERRVGKLMKKKGMVGLAIAVIEDGEIVYANGFGRTQRQSGTPVTADTVFRWASVSKSVGAAMALAAVEDGHFDLHTPVQAFAPSLALPDSPFPLVLEDLLSHRTGIARNAYDRKIEDGLPAKRVRSMVGGLKNACDPGTCHGYQNSIYDASAEMVETVYGVPYKSTVNARVFEPLGMDTASTTLAGLTRSADWARPHNAAGYTYNRVKPTYYRIPAAAGINSSVTDLAKWAIANVDGGNAALSGAQQVDMRTPRVPTYRENRNMRRRYPVLRNAAYGLGWRIYDYEGRRVFGHRGAVQGYRASLMMDPESKSGVAMLWNSNTSKPNGLTFEIMDQIYDRPRRDWLRLNPPRPRTRVAKAKPKPRTLKTMTASAVPEDPFAPPPLTDADIERLQAEMDQRIYEEALAATTAATATDDSASDDGSDIASDVAPDVPVEPALAQLASAPIPQAPDLSEVDPASLTPEERATQLYQEFLAETAVMVDETVTSGGN